MGRKSREKKKRNTKGINTSIPSDILGTPEVKLPHLEDSSKQKVTKCKVLDCELPKLIALLADIATGIWRIKNKFSDVDINGLPAEMKKAYRHIESTWDALVSAKIKIRGHDNEKYVAGMALNVIAFQPSSSVHTEIITETIKPSIFYNGQLIQMGDVIVETPEKTYPKKDDNEGVFEIKERNK
jgi:hypothetical protein